MINKQVCLLTLAKGKSKRLSNKNMHLFNGKPLLFWTIKKALKITNNYFVNSDSDEILNFAKKNGAKIIKRNKKLLEHEVPSRLIMDDSFKNFPKKTEAVIHVQANSPNLEIKKIKQMYEMMKYTSIEDIYTIFSNGELNGSMWGLTKKKLTKINKTKNLNSKEINSECWLVDDSIDIHYLKELKKAEKIFKNS